MLTFILIHGALYGSWGWEKVVNLLQEQGHQAIVLDLPGRAGDPSDPRTITLQTAVKKVCDVVALQKGPVVLVGHSQGGLVISQAAEACPDKIAHLVYVAALLPQNGDSLFSLVGKDKDALVGPYLVPDAGAGLIHLKEGAPFKEIFCADCSDKDVARAKAMLVSEPIGIGSTPVSLTNERFGKVPKTFIETTEDRTVSPSLQQMMYTATPVNKVIRIKSGHSPFLSVPEELVRNLIP